MILSTKLFLPGVFLPVFRQPFFSLLVSLPWRPKILLALDEGQSLAEPLVQGDRGMGHPLVLVEGGAGQGHAPPAHVEPAVGDGVGVDVPAGEPDRHLVPLEHDPAALEEEGQLAADITLLPPAEDGAQTLGGHVQRSVPVLRTGRRDGEPGVEALDEARQERVAGGDPLAPGHAQLSATTWPIRSRSEAGQGPARDQAVLQRPVDPLDATPSAV